MVFFFLFLGGGFCCGFLGFCAFVFLFVWGLLFFFVVLLFLFGVSWSVFCV